MNIWALSDPHLAFGAKDKNMNVFGDSWMDYENRIKTEWEKVVASEDIVLIPGDISWAISLENALIDLNWIAKLPGKKILLKGNHDYWWPSNKKLKDALPESIEFINNTAINIGSIAIGGARLWDTPEYNFTPFIDFVENPRESEKKIDLDSQEKIFLRDLERLKLSLSLMNKNAKTKIALTHYPPIGADLKDSRASAIFEEFSIDYVIFGHLHNVKPNALPFGEKNGVKYLFASADYLQFKPLLVKRFSLS